MTATAAYLAATGNASAHTFVVPYNLPIPLWLYIFSCGATLVLTFAILALHSVGSAAATTSETSPKLAWYDRESHVDAGGIADFVWVLLKAGSVLLLFITIFDGIFGTQNPNINPNMDLFWFVFVLLYTYSVAIFGNTFEIINPWKVIYESTLERIIAPKLNYPDFLSYWPSFILYVGFIWYELLVLPWPMALSVTLLCYSIFTIAGATLFGKNVWFEKVEFFSVFYRILGHLAPIAYNGANPSQLTFRWPLARTIRRAPETLAQLLFILFMLASTTYDGLNGTTLWVRLYWSNALAVLQPLFGDDLAMAQQILAPGYEIYRRVGLVAAPFLYLFLYWITIKAASLLSGGEYRTLDLMKKFSLSLIPIAIVYHFAHYFAFMIASAVKIPAILTDPLAMGWNILGIRAFPETPPVDMALVWHVMLVLILLGHVASVWIAHEIAVRMIGRGGRTIRIELPLLVLMVLYTFFGLFVLSLPLALH